MTRTSALILPIVLLTTAIGCTQPMGPLQAADALGQSARSANGINATQAPIEVSTDFTIGSGLEQAASQLRELWSSQVPCNDVTVEGSLITVDWGTLEDGCTWNGRSYAGVTTLSVHRTDAEDLELEHTWIGFRNEDVQVDGGALVTWSAQERTRSVQTEHTWTADDETVDVVGEHTFGVRGAGEALTLDGTRTWSSDRGDWHLEVVGIEARLQDPLPEAGSYSVQDPEGRTLEVLFSRVDEDTIEAVLTGVRGGDLVYHVTGRGDFERVDEGRNPRRTAR